jgi:hypothetical protein
MGYDIQKSNLDPEILVDMPSVVVLLLRLCTL